MSVIWHLGSGGLNDVTDLGSLPKAHILVFGWGVAVATPCTLPFLSTVATSSAAQPLKPVAPGVMFGANSGVGVPAAGATSIGAATLNMQHSVGRNREPLK